MNVPAKEISSDEYVDVTLDVQSVITKDDPLAYYARCTDEDGEQVMVTVFDDNRPDVDLREGNRYRLESVKGDVWDDGTPGVVVRPTTTVREVTTEPRTPDDPGESTRDRTVTTVVGNEIVEDEFVNIALEIDHIDSKPEDSLLAYHAWCSDENGETVVVTVFDDNRPELDLREGEWYEFTRVLGERWNDGTPGILFRSQSDVHLHEKTNTPEPTRSEPLAIDAISGDLRTERDHAMLETLPPWSGIFVSSLVTALAIGASLFATDVGVVGSGVLLVVGSGLAAVAAYQSQYSPNRKLRQKRKRTHVRLFLELLRQDYYELVDCDATVRANVMTVERDGLWPRHRSLAIFSHTDGYKPSELELKYDPDEKEGSCGRAFHTGEITVFDSESYPEAEIDLKPVQKDVTSDTNSILSVPVSVESGRRRRTVGVLNLDSEEPITDTEFNSDDIHNLVVRYADVIGDVLE